MDKTTLYVKHVGPIEEVCLDVKRINLFLGPQSSGKSTLAKILSQALWAEKNFITRGKKKDFFKELIDFHNMSRAYFSHRNLEIIYDSPWCKITMFYKDNKRDPQTSYKKKECKDLYHNTKIEYIPAERNFLTIENINQYIAETVNNIMSFLYDWDRAKKKYRYRKKFEVELPDLKFSYRYKEHSEQDIIRMGNGAEVEPPSASSGQRSLLPLLVVSYEVLKEIYDGTKVLSTEEKSHIERGISDKSMTAFLDVIGEINKQSRTKKVENQLKIMWKELGYIGDYGGTHLVIEEPEQNLYPSTQRGLLQHLVSLLIGDKVRNHTLTLTTHSPFILYALDNCMLAGMAVDRGKAEKLDAATRASAISPKNVGLWLLRDGDIIPLQDEEDHLLNKDLFNDEFQEKNEQMFQLLRIIDGKEK